MQKADAVLAKFLFLKGSVNVVISHENVIVVRSMEFGASGFPKAQVHTEI